jgi:hypothetical protein
MAAYFKYMPDKLREEFREFIYVDGSEFPSNQMTKVLYRITVTNHRSSLEMKSETTGQLTTTIRIEHALNSMKINNLLTRAILQAYLRDRINWIRFTAGYRICFFI